MLKEAKIVGEPKVIKGVLEFTAKAIDKRVDMRSICGQCSLNDICKGTFYPNYKKAGIKLSLPIVTNISAEDSSKCGIIIDLLARKNKTEPGFFPKLGYSPTT